MRYTNRRLLYLLYFTDGRMQSHSKYRGQTELLQHYTLVR